MGVCYNNFAGTTDMTTIAIPQNTPLEQSTEHPHVTRVKGYAVVRGSRIPVRLIAQMYREGDSVDDILHTYPHLTATAVHDAISYYLDHRAEIEKEIASNKIENVLNEIGAQMDKRGFIKLPKRRHNG
jgi:uncharacterized protein (DUF433 family)